MTKPELAQQIYQTVINAASKMDAVSGIEALISMLEPTDPEGFARWGFKKKTYPAPFKSQAEYDEWSKQ